MCNCRGAPGMCCASGLVQHCVCHISILHWRTKRLTDDLPQILRLCCLKRFLQGCNGWGVPSLFLFGWQISMFTYDSHLDNQKHIVWGSDFTSMTQGLLTGFAPSADKCRNSLSWEYKKFLSSALRHPLQATAEESCISSEINLWSWRESAKWYIYRSQMQT